MVGWRPPVLRCVPWWLSVPIFASFYCIFGHIFNYLFFIILIFNCKKIGKNEEKWAKSPKIGGQLIWKIFVIFCDFFPIFTDKILTKIAKNRQKIAKSTNKCEKHNRYAKVRTIARAPTHWIRGGRHPLRKGAGAQLRAFKFEIKKKCKILKKTWKKLVNKRGAHETEFDGWVMRSIYQRRRIIATWKHQLMSTSLCAP